MNLSVIGLMFPVSMVLGYLGGRFVGGFFEAPRLGGFLGGLLGIVSAFYNMYKMVSEFASTSSSGHGDKPS